jgi:hypothetical protein
MRSHSQFLQIQRQLLLRNTTEPAFMKLRLVPNIPDAIEMILPGHSQLHTTDSKAPVTRHIKRVAAALRVLIYHAIRSKFVRHDMHQDVRSSDWGYL